MSDFRTELYERYVSTFKGAERAVSPADRESYFRWCRHKFLPLFDDLSRDGRILELGCGAGDMLEYLGRNGFSAVEGIDLAPEQVRLATERVLNARVADVFDVRANFSGVKGGKGCMVSSPTQRPLNALSLPNFSCGPGIDISMAVLSCSITLMVYGGDGARPIAL